jgi:hypothetical protein
VAEAAKSKVARGLRGMHERASSPRHGNPGGGKVEKVMHEWKEGTLHSGSKRGPIVGGRKQAIAIALSEARRAGEKVKPMRGKGRKRK